MYEELGHLFSAILQKLAESVMCCRIRILSYNSTELYIFQEV